MTGLLLGCLLLFVSALPAWSEIYKCPDGKGGVILKDEPCAGSQAPQPAPAGGQSGNAPVGSAPFGEKSTDRVIAAFPSGERYYKSMFDYRTSDTQRIRLDTPVSEELATACLERYRGELTDPRSPYVHEAAITQRTWKSSHGNVRRATEILLDARAKNRFGGYVQTILACPLTQDNTIDDEGMKGHLAGFRLGIPIK